MVALGYIAVARLLYPVARDILRVAEGYGAVGSLAFHIALALSVAFLIGYLTQCSSNSGISHVAGIIVMTLCFINLSICQQVLGQIDILEAPDATIVEQRWEEGTILQISVRSRLDVILLIGSCLVLTREVDSRHVLVSLDDRNILLRLGKDSIRVEVSHTHLRVAEVGRCTVDAVARLSKV